MLPEIGTPSRKLAKPLPELMAVTAGLGPCVYVRSKTNWPPELRDRKAAIFIL